MIRDGEELSPGENLHADVCIVGAGAAGITLALEIARQAPGISVLVLEGGTDPRYNASPPPREVSPGQFLYEGRLEGDMTTLRPEFLTQTRSRSYGGSTNCWGGWCRPLEAVDFQGHGDYHPWPIPYEELTPFYGRAQGICSLDRFEYGTEHWVKRSAGSLAAIPDQEGDDLGSVVFQAIRDTRWSFFQDYRDELDAAPDVTVLTNANLTGIVAGAVEPGSRVDEVKALRLSTLDPQTGRPGRDFTATADRYVLALGGIETVRALLASVSPNQPRGLGNNTEQLGRFFNVHPVVTDAARVTFGRRGWPRPVRDFYATETLFPFEEPGQDDAPRAASGQEVQPYEGHGVSEKRFAGAQDDTNAYTRVWATLTPTPEALRRTEAGNFRVILRGDLTRATVDVNWEQVYDFDNQVALTDEKDVFGIPRVVLKWHIHRRDEDTYCTALELAEAKLRSAGYLEGGGSFQALFDIRDRATWKQDLPNPGDHHMGGTRMSAAPEGGVVDPDTRVHGMTNLFVSSCSVWPSAGWANPTLTIVAMASRLAHHLIGLAGAARSVPTHQATIPSPEPAPGGPT
jgi:choline dehydrogenase-like flavoprotein